MILFTFLIGSLNLLTLCLKQFLDFQSPRVVCFDCSSSGSLRLNRKMHKTLTLAEVRSFDPLAIRCPSTQPRVTYAYMDTKQRCPHRSCLTPATDSMDRKSLDKAFAFTTPTMRQPPGGRKGKGIIHT